MKDEKLSKISIGKLPRLELSGQSGGEVDVGTAKVTPVNETRPQVATRRPKRQRKTNPFRLMKSLVRYVI
uniref:Bacteriocin n=1 Tax=Angiostrongylus cantonensis TaxID=6313 RepID=A0A0K0CVA0_ANGCA